jgi:hypothetical protein
MYTNTDIINALSNPFINSLSPLEYGKAVQSAVEEYVTFKVNEIAEKEILLDVSSNEDLIEEFNYKNNGPGFDRLISDSKKRIQIKFRQVDGTEPWSRQVHFENTRRHSKKNNNSSSKSGLVCYSVSEFDYIILVLCHIKDGVRQNFHEWSFSLILVEDLEDVNNPGYCLPKIPSQIILRNYLENIYLLTESLKQII